MKRVKLKTSFSGTRILAIFLLLIPTGFSNFVREHDRFKSNGPDLDTHSIWMTLTEFETGDALLFFKLIFYNFL